MSADEFRRQGRAVVDWIADYYERIESLPVLSQVEPGEIRATPPRRSSRATGSRSTTILRGRGPADPAGDHALAVAELLRLLPGQRVGPGDPRRPALLGSGRAGDALGDQPRLHRTRDARPRLARRDARSAASGSARPRRRRRDPGHRLERSALRPSGGARARDGVCEQRARLRRAADRLHVDPGALVDREGGQDRRDRAGESPADRRGRTIRHATRRARRQHRRRPAGRAALRSSSAATVGTTSSNAIDPIPRDRADLPRARDSGSTSTPRCPARRRSARSSAGSRTASNSPTATASIRTSGCSRTSTATASSWPTARH